MQLPNTVEIPSEEDAFRIISDERAKELYRETENFALRKQISLRDFIFYRWQMGRYFSQKKEDSESSTDWIFWVSTKWPEIDTDTTNMWIGLAQTVSITDFTAASINKLKGIYMNMLTIQRH